MASNESNKAASEGCRLGQDREACGCSPELHGPAWQTLLLSMLDTQAEIATGKRNHDGIQAKHPHKPLLFGHAKFRGAKWSQHQLDRWMGEGTAQSHAHA